MISSIDTARQTIVSALNNLSNETHTNGAFPWSFGQITGNLVDDVDYDDLKSNLRVAESVEELLRLMLASASDVLTDLKTAVESYLWTLADLAEFEYIYKRKQVITLYKQGFP
ncbi:hypothetical protein SCHPADRAFT_696657 [Schizopora paradoxa]|uniref:Uncharacterized protein n=1 Tax=Schizopora paradoxa TaxID=27342 RepID=A0A0H2R9N2_9AGAM|nr:hypothetical protein SCHPADRAFT_696657 [Schizopora paradoxa]